MSCPFEISKINSLLMTEVLNQTKIFPSPLLLITLSQDAAKLYVTFNSVDLSKQPS
jgi:hypothetical protein